MCRSVESAIELMDRGLAALPGWAALQPPEQQGELIIYYRKVIDRLEAASAEATRRFEKSGAYKADGALGMVPWLHHRRVHEDGWRLEHKDGRWIATPPITEILARARTG
jgi:hypothetical protein